MPTADAASLHRRLRDLYSDHHGWLVEWLRRRFGCPHDAADIAQDTFVRLLGKSRQEIDGVRELRSWLSTIARGIAIDKARRQAIERAYLDALATLPEPVSDSPEAHLLVIETLARIDALLHGLGAKVRLAFLMSRLEGLTYPEIADRLGVSLSSVEKYMAAALRHLYLMSCHG